MSNTQVNIVGEKAWGIITPLHYPPETPDEDYDWPYDDPVSERVVVWWQWVNPVNWVPITTGRIPCRIKETDPNPEGPDPTFGLKPRLEEVRFARYHYKGKRWDIEGISGQTEVLAFMHIPKIEI